MKRTICRFAHSTTVIVTALFFCMTIILASPLMSKAASATPAAKPTMSKVDRTDARIIELHAKLKITEVQEEQWKKVTQAMRENAVMMETLIQERKEKANTLNAVDDLKSYAKITDEHAAGLNRFIAAFEPLYAIMSDEQKKNADAIFTNHGQKHKKSKTK
jgi:periplasmic protein CpxP/Spy